MSSSPAPPASQSHDITLPPSNNFCCTCLPCSQRPGLHSFISILLIFKWLDSGHSCFILLPSSQIDKETIVALYCGWYGYLWAVGGIEHHTNPVKKNYFLPIDWRIKMTIIEFSSNTFYLSPHMHRTYIHHAYGQGLSFKGAELPDF